MPTGKVAFRTVDPPGTTRLWLWTQRPQSSVGQFTDSGGVSHGFIYSASAGYTVLDATTPGAGTYTRFCDQPIRSSRRQLLRRRSAAWVPLYRRQLSDGRSCEQRAYPGACRQCQRTGRGFYTDALGVTRDFSTIRRPMATRCSVRRQHVYRRGWCGNSGRVVGYYYKERAITDSRLRTAATSPRTRRQHGLSDADPGHQFQRQAHRREYQNASGDPTVGFAAAP